MTVALDHQLDLAAGVLHITVPGDILSTNADSLREESFGLLESEAVKQGVWHTLKLDLTAAQMVDSVGLNLIVALIRLVKSRNGTVETRVRSANIHRTFQFTRLDKQVNIVKA